MTKPDKFIISAFSKGLSVKLNVSIVKLFNMAIILQTKVLRKLLFFVSLKSPTFMMIIPAGDGIPT